MIWWMSDYNGEGSSSTRRTWIEILVEMTAAQQYGVVLHTEDVD